MLGAVRNGNQLILYPRPDIDMIVKRPRRARSRPSCPACRRSTPRSTSIPRRKGLDLKLAQDLPVGRRAIAGRGAAELREADRRDPDRRLRPHRDLADRRRSARSTRACAESGSCGVPIPGTIIEIRDMENPDKRAAGRQGECRRGLHHRPAGDEGLLEEAGRDRARCCSAIRRATGRACAPATWATWTTTAGSTWSTAPRT